MDKHYEFQCEKCGLTYPRDFENGNGICDFCEEQIQEEIDEFFLVECDICGENFDGQTMYHIPETEEDVCGNCLGKTEDELGVQRCEFCKGWFSEEEVYKIGGTLLCGDCVVEDNFPR